MRPKKPIPATRIIHKIWFGDVVKTTVLLQHISDFAAMNAVYAEFFTERMPARICFEVAALPMGALVEIDAVAVR